jgi:electron transfer flavoprotein alpha subunit
MIGASVGGSRPVVDFGFIPRQNQIGITGESISPELYVALGVSGADNHVVGIRYAKKILAVNSNPEAPIFKYSDYGVISDAYEFLNELRDHITLIREDQRSSR